MNTDIKSLIPSMHAVGMFRHLAMGRRNRMHTGSHLGAENIAFVFSLFESCKLNDINFGDYIEDIFTRLMEGGARLHVPNPM